MKKLRLIKGGPTVDLTTNVNLKFAERYSRALFYNKEKEKKELIGHLVEHDINKKEHELLLEILDQYNHLMSLGEVPFKYIANFRDFLEVVEKDEKELINR